jgi:hypothetical protein
MKETKQSKLKRAIGKAVSFVTNNADKVELVMDILRILTTKSSEEVTQYSISMEYTTEEGKTFKLTLPKSKAKDSSDIQNVIASIIAISANDIGATVEEVEKKVISRKETMDKIQENEASKSNI